MKQNNLVRCAYILNKFHNYIIALTETLSDNTLDDRLMDVMKACLRVVVLDICCEE